MDDNKTDNNRVAVMITTDKRGVFMGYINEEDANNDPLIVENMHMCVHWSEATRGVIGLASHGPLEGSRITAAAPKALLKGITAVVHISPEAEKRWLDKPWS